MTFGVEPRDLGKISGAMRLHLHTYLPNETDII